MNHWSRKAHIIPFFGSKKEVFAELQEKSENDLDGKIQVYEYETFSAKQFLRIFSGYTDITVLFLLKESYEELNKIVSLIRSYGKA